MTASIDYTTLPHSIAALTITGVTICDIHNIPTNMERKLPILFPDPDGWLGNVGVTVDSYGTSGSEKLTMGWTLSYIFMLAKSGTGRVETDNYNAMIVKVGAIATVIVNTDSLSGADDIRLESIEAPGYVQAPNGDFYHGCRFALRASKFLT
jgi:hypothetical protein